ncbi:MAG: GTPase HflX [Kofleriaceae bacterium]|nr:GTPase HflX [Kofleriaceae bacterium]
MIEQTNKTGPDLAIIVGGYHGRDLAIADLLLDELESLVSAAGGQTLARLIQRFSDNRSMRPSTYIGKGKAEFLAELVEANEANIVIFDNELSPAQVRTLEEVVGCRVIDRSELILDIFASRARTRESRVQVELAQLQYTAPRLKGMWSHLERQAGGSGSAGGGMGLRGPGEKQIEIDRRLISKRLVRLRAELETIHKRRRREVNSRVGKHYCVGLVGYTNAGKSTLLNQLTSANAYSADQLFATLDTKTRRWALPGGIAMMLSDTVGFVRNLPHQLVASFRSTLQEALEADLLLHVIDASHPEVLSQLETVESVLDELGCDLSKLICVLNKVDLVKDPDIISVLRARLPDTVVISAVTGEGIDALCDLVLLRYRESCTRFRVIAPLSSGKLQAFARANCGVDCEDYGEESWTAELSVPEAMVTRMRSLCPDARFERLSPV